MEQRTIAGRHVTFCVPAFNGASVIGDALASIRQQTHQDFTVLISDDCSQDGTPDVCTGFLADDRFALYVQPRRLGWVENCNWLLAKAASDFVCILPQDDALAPTFAAKLLDALVPPNRVMAFPDVEWFGARQGVSSASTVEGNRVERARQFLRSHYDGLAFRGLLRRRVLETAGGLRANRTGGYAADIGWLCRIACCGDMVRVPEALYRKRYDPGSVSGRWGQLPADQLAEAWCMHCSEIAQSLLDLKFQPDELRALAPAWVERVLGLGFPDLRGIMVSLPPDMQRDLIARTSQTFVLTYARQRGDMPVPASACEDFADLLTALSFEALSNPASPPSPEPPVHGLEYRVARTPRNLVNFLFGRPLKAHSAQMRATQTPAK
ncbi:MAG: glycosyltransferase family 2 protein [Xanthobacteraceae bacterium]